MRHIGTLIAAVVIAPLAWLLIAFGQEHSLTAFATAQSSGTFHTGDFVRPLITLAAAGILLGLIATLRFSPLGAVVAGAVYAASYVALLIAPGRVDSLLSYRIKIAGQQASVETPVQTGTTLILGALLLVAVASVKRWRRWPVSEQPATGEAISTDPIDEVPPAGLSPNLLSWPASDPRGAESDSAGFGSGFGGTASGGGEPISAEPVTTQRIVSRPTTTPSGSPWRTPPRDDTDGT
jgi:hypothetical protein